MNILVLNGSPKGENSITLQTLRYLEKKFHIENMQVLPVGQRIKALEKDFSPALEAIEKADLLLFSYPVYTFLAPCQLHRFIELMKEHGAAFAGKLATQVTTSKHFYDTTAHRYIQDKGVKEMGKKIGKILLLCAGAVLVVILSDKLHIPMKYFSNGLLALGIAFIINFLVLQKTSRRRVLKKQERLEAVKHTHSFENVTVKLVSSTMIRK